MKRKPRFSLLFTLAFGWLTTNLVTNAFASSAQQVQTPTILVFGDSLSAAYGISIEKGWVSLLQERLQKENYRYQLINASISGETTAGGKVRLPAALKQYQPTLVLLELGANDALRGSSLTAMQSNLQTMLRMIKANRATPLLIGMQIPPNYGQSYAQQFTQSYQTLANQEKVALVPFLLAGFADDSSWFQADQIHPTEKAQLQILETVWTKLRPLLTKK